MFESANIQKEINIRNKEMKNLFKSLKSNENPPIENLSLDKNDSQEDIKILQEEISNLKQQKAVVDEQIIEKI